MTNRLLAAWIMLAAAASGVLFLAAAELRGFQPNFCDRNPTWCEWRQA